MFHCNGWCYPWTIPMLNGKTICLRNIVIKKIFELIEKHGKVDNTEMHQVFNMGIGMIAIVSGSKADSVLRSIRRRGHDAWIVGEVTKGRGKVKLS